MPWAAHEGNHWTGRSAYPRRIVKSASVDVVLLDAHYRQTVAAMRVYGRAGLRVGALACEQEYSWAPALKSRWCSVAASAPSYTVDPDGYVDALLRFDKDTSARLVVPAHDGSI